MEVWRACLDGRNGWVKSVMAAVERTVRIDALANELVTV